MTLLLVEVDMQKIKQFPVEWVPGQIDAILEPHHVKWSYGNYYVVEEGYHEECAVKGAIEALQGTAWLRGAVHVQVVRRVVRRKLAQINTENMAPPALDKMEQCRKYFKDKKLSSSRLVYPNPIVIDEENKLLDGYTTYLLMQERGMQEAACVLVRGGNRG